jgi:hypothetical protein
VASFLARAALTAMVLITTAGNGPALTIDLRLGYSAINQAIGGLILQQGFDKPYPIGLVSRHLL